MVDKVAPGRSGDSGVASGCANNRRLSPSDHAFAVEQTVAARTEYGVAMLRGLLSCMLLAPLVAQAPAVDGLLDASWKVRNATARALLAVPSEQLDVDGLLRVLRAEWDGRLPGPDAVIYGDVGRRPFPAKNRDTSLGSGLASRRSGG